MIAMTNDSKWQMTGNESKWKMTANDSKWQMTIMMTMTIANKYVKLLLTFSLWYLELGLVSYWIKTIIVNYMFQH